MIKGTTLPPSLRALAGVTLVGGLAACSGASRHPACRINDPFSRPQQRKIHALNQKISALRKTENRRWRAAVPTSSSLSFTTAV